MLFDLIIHVAFLLSNLFLQNLLSKKSNTPSQATLLSIYYSSPVYIQHDITLGFSTQFKI